MSGQIEDTCCRARRRVHEVAVGGAIGRRHGHVRFGYRDRIGDLREHQGDPRPDEHAELPACHLAEGLELLPIVLKMILIAHVRSFSLVIAVQAEVCVRAGGFASRDGPGFFDQEAKRTSSAIGRRL